MTYKLNHPGTAVIRADLLLSPVDVDLLRGRVDLVLGGIPCQWLSTYRNWSQGTTVTPAEVLRGQALLDAILGVVRVLQPRWWCLEDVIQLRDHLPPLTPYQIIDSSAYSAQRRKRLFVGDFPTPPPGRCDLRLQDCLRPGPYRVGRRLYGRTPETQRTFARDRCHGAFPDRKSPTVCGFNSRRDGEIGVVGDWPGGLRQIEWQESARLQGYPDDYLFWGSPTDVSTMIGNSIQIDTGRAILQSIVRSAQDEHLRPSAFICGSNLEDS